MAAKPGERKTVAVYRVQKREGSWQIVSIRAGRVILTGMTLRVAHTTAMQALNHRRREHMRVL